MALPAAAPAPAESACLAGALRELRESEAEAARLRGEVQQLRTQLADAQRGASVEFLSAGETLTEWGRACQEAESYVYVACFTYDHPRVTAMLEEARRRGLTVQLVFSGRDKNTTNSQIPRLQQLRACGAEVRAHKGSRLHAKVLLTEREILIGSCNFTSASQANVERGVRLQDLSEATAIAQKEWFGRLFGAAQPFTDGIGAAIPPSPAR